MTEKSTDIIGALLTIGDEILLGDIPNGNAHYIAFELRRRGFRIGRMITVGDREDEIAEALSDCLKGSSFLIVTGGLGPTDDDRTCAAAARAFKRPLAVNRAYFDRLKERTSSRGHTWSRHIARMAELPEGAEKLSLDMAGFFLVHENVPCYFLPGVPGEVKTLIGDTVIPGLEKRFPRRRFYVKRVIRVQGLFESQINRRLDDLYGPGLGVEIGYLPQGVENWVTLLASGETEEECRGKIGEAEKLVVDRLGAERVCGFDEESPELIAGRMLRDRGRRIAVAESCSGGLLSFKITSISGASDYFERGYITYSNRAKTELLGVPEKLIEEHGAVSEPVAEAMAKGAAKRAGVETALSITGIAGPTGGSPEKPVGTVFIACVTPGRSAVEKYLFRGNREQIRENSAQAALLLLRRTLDDDSSLHCD